MYVRVYLNVQAHTYLSFTNQAWYRCVYDQNKYELCNAHRLSSKAFILSQNSNFEPIVTTTSIRQKGPIPKWTIQKHQSDKNQKCLYISNFGILSVVCSASTVGCLCRVFKYLLKIWYIILDYILKWSDFLIFETLCLSRSKILAYGSK